MRPRHYILLAILLALLAFNLIRYRQRKQQQQAIAALQAVRTTPAWTAYDAAANLRDAPDAQFQPAFTALRAATETPAPEANITACKTWLLFYRQPAWRDKARPHVNGCTQFHTDTTAP
jgi:type II secretory pathway pseudopilin PulG